MKDILLLLQLQKIIRTFRDSWSLVEAIQKYSGASKTSAKCLEPSGTSGVLYKSHKNIGKLFRHSETSTTSEQCLGPSRTPRVYSTLPEGSERLENGEKGKITLHSN